MALVIAGVICHYILYKYLLVAGRAVDNIARLCGIYNRGDYMIY